MTPSPIRILFVAGPSGAGKSTLGRWLAEEMDWLHLEPDCRDITEEATIDHTGLAPAWQDFVFHQDAITLASTLLARANLAGFSQIVVTFSSLRLLSPDDIRNLRQHGIDTVILFGKPEECLEAFLARERQNGSPLDDKHWHHYNSGNYRHYAQPEYDTLRINMFTSGTRRAHADVLADIMATSSDNRNS